MSKFLRLMFAMAVSAACVLPCFNAEAATIAVVPLVNQTVEHEDANGVYFDRVVEALKKNGEFELVDDDAVNKAIDKYTKPGILPDVQAMQAICNEGNVDAVFAYQLENLSDEQVLYGTEWTYYVHLRGKVAGYNTLAKKPIRNNKVVEDVERPYSESARFNIPQEVFADSVTREINRVIGNKKLNLAGPKISARGQKGNR